MNSRAESKLEKREKLLNLGTLNNLFCRETEKSVYKTCKELKSRVRQCPIIVNQMVIVINFAESKPEIYE